MNKVITKVHSENVKDWYEDSEIKINPINGYHSIFRRIFYEKGYVKRIVIGFTKEEREIASNLI
jgi:polyphosphate kinase 2 (PPK2 family)